MKIEVLERIMNYRKKTKNPRQQKCASWGLGVGLKFRKFFFIQIAYIFYELYFCWKNILIGVKYFKILY